MSKYLIAVIDDDELFRVALVESLSSLGYRAHDYASGEAFMQKAGDTAYGCIVTDIHMPGISGLELMEQLAARGVTTPVVLITARLDASLPASARKAAGLFTKPFDVEALVRCIETSRAPTAD